MPSHTRTIRFALSLFVSLLGCLLGPALARAAPQDVTTLVSRLRADKLATTSTSSAAGDLSSQQSDGCWPDVDYTDTSLAVWVPITHLGAGMAVSPHPTRPPPERPCSRA